MSLPTPRTDAASFKVKQLPYEVVYASVSRNLETELTEANVRADYLEKDNKVLLMQRNRAMVRYEKAEAQLKDAKKWLDERYKALSEADDALNDANARAEEAISVAREAGEALKELHDHYKGWTIKGAIFNQVEKALDRLAALETRLTNDK